MSLKLSVSGFQGISSLSIEFDGHSRLEGHGKSTVGRALQWVVTGIFEYAEGLVHFEAGPAEHGQGHFGAVSVMLELPALAKLAGGAAAGRQNADTKTGGRIIRSATGVKHDRVQQLTFITEKGAPAMTGDEAQLAIYELLLPGIPKQDRVQEFLRRYFVNAPRRRKNTPINIFSTLSAASRLEIVSTAEMHLPWTVSGLRTDLRAELLECKEGFEQKISYTEREIISMLLDACLRKTEAKLPLFLFADDLFTRDLDLPIQEKVVGLYKDLAVDSFIAASPHYGIGNDALKVVQLKDVSTSRVNFRKDTPFGRPAPEWFARIPEVVKPDCFYTVARLAEALGVDRAAVYQALRRRDVPPVDGTARGSLEKQWLGEILIKMARGASLNE